MTLIQESCIYRLCLALAAAYSDSGLHRLLAALGPGEDTAEDAVLWMELDRSERAVLEGAKVLQISVKPEELLLLA